MIRIIYLTTTELFPSIFTGSLENAFAVEKNLISLVYFFDNENVA